MPTDTERLDAYAGWIRQNKDRQGTPEFEKVAAAYKALRTGGEQAGPDPRSPEYLAGASNASRLALDIARARRETPGAFVPPDAAFERSRSLNDAKGLMANAYQGATFDTGDEIAGILGGVVNAVSDPFGRGGFSEGYDAASNAVQSDADAFAADNPWTAFGVRMLAGAPAAVAMAPARLLEATTPLARYGGAAVYGGVLGGLQGFASGEDGFGNRMNSAAGGATVGALLGPMLEGVVSGFRTLLARRVPFRVLDPNGQLTLEGASIVRDAGADPAQLPPGFLQRLDEVAKRSGGTPADTMAAFRMAQAETTPVPIPLTTGQAADDVTQLATERALSRSGGGMGIMNEFHRAQQEAIGANIPAMRERIAAGFPVVERGQGGEIISGRANQLYDEAATRSRGLYTEAERLTPPTPLADRPFGTDKRGAIDPLTGSRRDAQLGRPTSVSYDDTADAIEKTLAEFGIPYTKDVSRFSSDTHGPSPSVYYRTDAGTFRLSDHADVSGRPSFIYGDDPAVVRSKLAEATGRNPSSYDASRAEQLSARAADKRSWEAGAKSRNAAILAEWDRNALENAGMSGLRGPAKSKALGKLRADAKARGEWPPRPEEYAPPPDMEPYARPGPMTPGRRADLPQGESQRMMQNAWDAMVAEIPVPENAGPVASLLTRFGASADGAGLPIADIFQMRKMLTNLQGGAPSPTTIAARAAKRAIDQGLDDAVRNDLLAGDTEAVNAWREAINNYRDDFAARFKNDDFVAALVARDRSNGGRLKIDSREAVNYIFGSANLGFLKQRDFARNLANLRNVLGEDSQAWNAMKQEAFNRFADAALGQSTQNGRLFSGAKFAKAWEEANSDEMSRHILRLFFSDAERRDIGNLAQVMRRATTSDPNVYTPSASPFQIDRLLSRFGKRIPYVKRWVEGLDVVLSNARDAAEARAATGGALSRAKPVRPSTGAGILAAPVGSGILATQRQRQNP